MTNVDDLVRRYHAADEEARRLIDLANSRGWNQDEDATAVRKAVSKRNRLLFRIVEMR